jgi:hypothetical protein
MKLVESVHCLPNYADNNWVLFRFTIVDFSNGYLLFESRQNFLYLDESSN